MPRLPRLPAREVVRKLERDGWYLDHQSGSHAQHRHPTKPGTVTIPMHGNEILAPRTLRSIIRQAGLSEDAFRSL